MTFLKKIFGKGKLTASEYWAMSLIPMGQLYARVEKLDGSLDKEWSLFPLFMIPPFQFIPMTMINMGLLKKGKGGKPYDWYMIIPLIVKLLIGFSIAFALKIPNFVELGILFFAVLIPFIIRSLNHCGGFDFEALLNSAALTSYVIAITNIFTYVIGFIPLIGIAVTFVKLIPIWGMFILWSFGYVPSYIVANMIDGKDIVKKCYKFKYKIFYVVIAIALAVVTTIFLQ